MSDPDDSNLPEDPHPGMLIDAPRQGRIARMVGYSALIVAVAVTFVVLFNQLAGSWKIAIMVVGAMLAGMFLLARAGAGYFDQ